MKGPRFRSRAAALLLTALLLLCAFPLSAFAEPNGGLTLRLDPGAGETERAAAELLQTYLERITGERPAIGETDGAGRTVAISLRPEETARRKGAYTLRSDPADPVFYIEAADPRGVWNGVYGFLRRICGVEIFSATVETVPQYETLALPESCDYAYEPLLEYADTDWASGRDAVFCVANGLNGSRSGIEPIYGAPVNYIWFCHTLGSSLVPYWEYFDAHPEYYALTARSGAREPTQLCLSNPEVLRLTVEGVRRQLAESYDPDAALNIISVSQLDNFDYCVCGNCEALAERYGGPSGALIWFVNQVAEAVEPEYPDAVIDTFAYEYSRPAPAGIAPRRNVCVRLCSIECCYAHAIDDPACAVNAAFYKDLRDWAAICDRLYVWDYTTDFNQTLGVFPNYGVLRENLRVFRENNVVGVFEQGVGSTVACDTEFGDLRAWLLACNMREELTEEENEAAKRGFLEAYYGEGADEIEAVLAYYTAHAGDRDGHLYNRASMLKTMHGVAGRDVARLDALFADAAEKCGAAGNDAAAERVRRAELSWRYYKACNGLGEFARSLNFSRWTSANEALFRDLKAYGNASYDESKPMPETADPLLYPSAWVDAERMVLTVDLYLIPALAAAAIALTAAALIRKRYLLLLGLAAAGAAIGSTVWTVRLSDLPLALTAGALFAAIVLAAVPTAAAGYARGRGSRAAKIAAAATACVLAAAFAAVLLVLDRSMLNGLDSHLAYFTVCLVLEGLALLGLLTLLPCAFLKKKA